MNKAKYVIEYRKRSLAQFEVLLKTRKCSQNNVLIFFFFFFRGVIIQNNPFRYFKIPLFPLFPSTFTFFSPLTHSINIDWKVFLMGSTHIFALVIYLITF